MKNHTRRFRDVVLLIIYLPLMYICLTYYFEGYIVLAEWLSTRSVLLLILAGTFVGSLVVFLFAFLLGKAFAFGLGLMHTKIVKRIAQWLTVITTGFSGIQLLVITWNYLDFAKTTHVVTFLLFLFATIITFGYILFFVMSQAEMKEEKVQAEDGRFELPNLEKYYSKSDKS